MPPGGDPAVEAYLAELTRRVRAALGDDLLGAYLMGSAATGGFLPGVSDLDVWALARGPVAAAHRERLARDVGEDALPCPARGLELTVAWVGEDGLPVDETGPAAETRHFLILEAAVGRDHGRALAGPPLADAIPPIPRSVQLQAIAGALAWYAANEPENPSAVLTAARGWRYAVEGRWSSKEEAARWATGRRPDWRREIDRAIGGRSARAGSPPPTDRPRRAPR